MKRFGFAMLALAFSLSLAGSPLAEEADPAIAEGYEEEQESFKSVVSWCMNGEKNIYGKFYFPLDFDETATYPTVIMSHGLGSQARMVEKAGWPAAMTEAGFVVYAFDFCGGGQNSISDGDYLQMSILTEKADLNAVMDFVKSQSYVDPERLFLLGQSQGGVVSALTAAGRPEEVKAMVLVYPAFCLVDDLHAFVEDIDALEGDTFESAMGPLGTIYAKDAYDLDLWAEIGKYTGDVMIIHGVGDKTVPYTYSVDAINGPYAESFSELVLLGSKKSVHGFEMVYNQGRAYALEEGKDFFLQHLGEE